MLTYPVTGIETDERAAYRPFRARVARIETLSPSFRRITFQHDELLHLAPHGRDQRIKIVFPLDGVGMSDLGLDDPRSILEGSWYSRWRQLPDGRRNPFRTYTVRKVRPASGELDVDFVAHGDGGPAARWLASAAVGDEVVIVGPDVRSVHSMIGMDWHPGSATEVLLVGDETATPAICGILESLPAGMRAHALIEVPRAGDALVIDTVADVDVIWLDRSAGGLPTAVSRWADAHRSAWAPALAAAPQMVEDIDVDRELLWDAPADTAGDFYAWLAGESATIKALRRFLVSELGIDRRRVAFMGYWRLGKAEAQG